MQGTFSASAVAAKVVRDGGFSPEEPLVAALSVQLEAAADAWPALDFPLNSLAKALLERSSARPADLAALQAADLHLALAAGQRDESAIIELLALLHREAPKWLRKVPVEASDIVQRMAERLLPFEGESPLLKYEAKAPLSAWLRVLATRLGIDTVRSEAREKARGTAFEASFFGRSGDAEMEILRARCGADFRTAARLAMEDLEDRSRTLLYAHYCEGRGLDEIAAEYNVHRVTLSRWLAAARGELEQGIRGRLRALTRMSDDECESALRLIGSQLSLSLSALAT